MKIKNLATTGLLLLVVSLSSLNSGGQTQPVLTVKQIMTDLIAPDSATIWGAYQLESEAQWKEIEVAAQRVIAAANLLASGGASEADKVKAADGDWQQYNQQMLEAARDVLVAVGQKDEEALFNAGNDALYPPCESCHQQYQSR